MNEVGNFLKRFHTDNNIDKVFTGDCCYWFALILFRRFIRDGATIMYDKTKNYFGTKINGRVYDISGDVTDIYDWVLWSELTDDYKEQVTCNCIMF